MCADTPKAATQVGSPSPKENSFGDVSLDRKAKELSREDSKGPSPQLITRLSRLGELPQQHDDVAGQVSKALLVFESVYFVIDKDILSSVVQKAVSTGVSI